MFESQTLSEWNIESYRLLILKKGSPCHFNDSFLERFIRKVRADWWVIMASFSVFSAPSTLPVSPAEFATSPLHPLQPMGRSFQHYVHPPGPLQWSEPSNHSISVLCPEGNVPLSQLDLLWCFSFIWYGLYAGNLFSRSMNKIYREWKKAFKLSLMFLRGRVQVAGI